MTKSKTDIQKFKEQLDKLDDYISLLSQANKKRETIRESAWYKIFVGEKQRNNDLRKNELVILRIQNRINNLCKNLEL